MAFKLHELISPVKLKYLKKPTLTCPYIAYDKTGKNRLKVIKRDGFKNQV